MAYKPLKLWFDGDLVRLLSAKIKKERPDFEEIGFSEFINSRINQLELKDRVEVFADGLHVFLSEDYEVNLRVLVKILGSENDKETGMFTEYYWVMPIAKYVEKYGLEFPDASYDAMEEITKRNTSEYTVRPYLVRYPDKTLSKMLEWAQSDNKHVRRLASEGGRPRLPWAQKLDQFIQDPSPLLPILNLLKDDPSKYVQKSVANCLNDILKDNPEIGKNEIEAWCPSPTRQRSWIIKHALRNLIKAQDPWAIQLLESSQKPKIS